MIQNKTSSTVTEAGISLGAWNQSQYKTLTEVTPSTTELSKKATDNAKGQIKNMTLNGTEQPKNVTEVEVNAILEQ